MAARENFHIASDDSISSARVEPGLVRWRLVLVVLMRLLAGLWMLRALLAWSAILGAAPGSGFDDMETGAQAVVCAYAVIHCVVSVGLWLATSWGAALWILMALADVAVRFYVPGSAVTSDAIIVFTGCCIVLYAGLAWLAHRESRQAVH